MILHYNLTARQHVLQDISHAGTAPYSVALLAWIVVLGPGPLSLDGMFRPGMGAAALPLVGLFTRGLAGLTKRIGPAYALLLRLWISAGLAAIALGGVQGLSKMLPASMAPSAAMAWLPQMSGMAAGLAPWALLALAALLALGLFTRVVALLLIVLIPTAMLSSGGDIGWITLLNLPLLGLPLLYGAGAVSLDTIGRQAAVADFGGVRVRGAPAWWLWGTAHIAFLIGVRNRITVLATWLWAYLTFRRGSRLITGAGL